MQGLAADIHVSSQAEIKEFLQNKAVDSVQFEHRDQSRWIHVLK